MTAAYELIKTYYGNNTAKRSGVPLINHIDEGLAILDKLGADQVTKDAYCLHPLLQSDEALLKSDLINFTDVPVKAIILAMEYRRVANSYLSKNQVSEFVGFSLPEVRQMLIADKVQNYRDFLIYHAGVHERSRELHIYFNNWFDLLGIDYLDYAEVKP